MPKEVLANSSKGIRILLVPEVQVSDWILTQPGISLNSEELKGKKLPVVEIAKGEAGFFPGGSVGLRVGRQRNYRIGFNPKLVLEIQTLNGELIERNYHMCVECCANTGKVIDHSPSAEFAGLIDATFQCEQNPDHQWKLNHI